ncbi:UNKNOWN [Stylonychia lemnae]|uniref:Uncharacterized protein n=1 Tax=Stylonychia lemnae TaxID=5949 RepID=A0A078ART5_STYLE|nr:UNKNOWN [Stylonychia lemnae]|eukprot:CDW83588.1 UNKNOWN [Stylonychia lemnae]
MRLSVQVRRNPFDSDENHLNLAPNPYATLQKSNTLPIGSSGVLSGLNSALQTKSTIQNGVAADYQQQYQRYSLPPNGFNQSSSPQQVLMQNASIQQQQNFAPLSQKSHQFNSQFTFNPAGHSMFNVQNSQQSQFSQQSITQLSQNQQQPLTINQNPFASMTHQSQQSYANSTPQLQQKTLTSFMQTQNPQSQTQSKQRQIAQKSVQNDTTSIYDHTLKLMMESQKLRKKELDALKDKECVLLCFRCQKPVSVVDKQNDKFSKMNKDEQQKYLEDQHQVGKVSNDIVEVYIKQKCVGCARFTCQNCMDECTTCQQKQCVLCLEYDGNNQKYHCSTCMLV